MTRPALPPRRQLTEWYQLEDRTAPAVFTVTNPADFGAGSLREAVELANRDAAPDEIRFADDLAGSEFVLTRAARTEFGPTALVVSTPIRIVGDGETIRRSTDVGPMRLFLVRPRGSLELRDVVLSDGLAQGGDGAAGLTGGGGAAGLGGAVYNQGFLNITSSTFTGNRAVGGDGGDGGVGRLAGEGGTMAHNGSPVDPFLDGEAGPAGFGGGGDGDTELTNPPGGFGGGAGGTLGSAAAGGFGGGSSGGAAGGGGAGLGGAVFNQGGRVNITNSTFALNSAEGGAGGAVEGSRAAGENGAGFGGALFNLSGTVTVIFSTLARNLVQAPSTGTGRADGGAVFNAAVPVEGASGPDAYVSLIGSILANTGNGNDLANHAADGASARVSATSPNLIMSFERDEAIRTQGVLRADPQLGELGKHGGKTLTMSLGETSPAINAARKTVGPPTDQRSVRRADFADLGAFEAEYGREVVIADPIDPVDEPPSGGPGVIIDPPEDDFVGVEPPDVGGEPTPGADPISPGDGGTGGSPPEGGGGSGGIPPGPPGETDNGDGLPTPVSSPLIFGAADSGLPPPGTDDLGWWDYYWHFLF